MISEFYEDNRKKQEDMSANNIALIGEAINKTSLKVLDENNGHKEKDFGIYIPSCKGYSKELEDKIEDIDADYFVYRIKVVNIPAEPIDECRDLYNKYIKRGYNRKFNQLMRNSKNWQMIEKYKNLVVLSFNDIKSYLESKNETVVMSSIDNRIYVPCSKELDLNFIPECNMSVCLAIKKKGMTEKRPCDCRNCTYFSYAGKETSHEWIEFFPHCSKLRKLFEESKDGSVIPLSNCPLE